MITFSPSSDVKPQYQPLSDWSPVVGETFATADSDIAIIVSDTEAVFIDGTAPEDPELMLISDMGLAYRRCDITITIK